MISSREAAITEAKASYDAGHFLRRLERLVAVPTESHPPEHREDLVRYCNEVLGPLVKELGFSVSTLENPEWQHGPVMLATRLEDASLPTILIYGHGDVVRAMPEKWRADLDPWTVKVEGDKIYGRRRRQQGPTSAGDRGIAGGAVGSWTIGLQREDFR